MIDIQNISKSYEDKIVFRNVSARIGLGDSILLRGANGSGKTTLLKMILSRIMPNEGKIILKNPSEFYQKSYAVFPDMGLYSALTLEENIVFFCRIFRRNCRRSGEILHRLDLGKEKNTFISNLSAGNLMKAKISLGLILEMDYVFLDEPFAHLDTASRQAASDLLSGEFPRADRILVVVSHEENNIHPWFNRQWDIRHQSIEENKP